MTERESVEYIDPYKWETADRCIEYDQEHQDKDAEDRDAEEENAEEENAEEENAEDKDAEDGNSEAKDALLAEEAMLINAEYRAEPLRPPVEARVSMDQEKDLPRSLSAFRLRGGHEEGLKSNPFVVKISGLAGYSHMVNNNADLENVTAGTHQHSASATNPYAPFLSKLDWEVARWAKLRGPGSTAVTELTGIEGVSRCLSIEGQRM